MKKRRFYIGLAAICFSLCIIGSGLEAAAGDGSKPAREKIMHRSRAGEPDATGWSLAVSTKGDFSVMVPGLFDDFTLRGIAPDGVIISSDIVKSLTDEVSNFSAFRVAREDGRLPIGTVDQIVEKFRMKSFYFKKDKVNYQGLEGYEIVARNDKSTTVIRLFQEDGRLYELIVEYPSVLASAVEPDVSRFMESFTLRQPGDRQ